MIRQVRPGVRRGTVAAPPAKSDTHRRLIAAALSPTGGCIHGAARCDDTAATLRCLTALGAAVRETADTVTVGGLTPGGIPKEPPDCGESGSTLRFLLPLALLGDHPVTFTGSPRLFQRPLEPYAALCRQNACRFDRFDCGVTVCGPLSPGTFALPGDVSSQFFTGLLFALPLLSGNSRLTAATPLHSRPYVDETLSVLAQSGIVIRREGDDFVIPGSQQYAAPATVTVQGDWSAAAPFLALAALGDPVTVTGLPPGGHDSTAKALFAAVCAGRTTLSLRDCPDLGPLLFVLAALRHGAVFTDTRRLRDKESDRIAAITQALLACGGDVTVADDSVTVSAVPLTPPAAPLSGCGDHRVVTALSVLLTRLGGTVTDAEAVSKSDPGFFETLAQLSE